MKPLTRLMTLDKEIKTLGTIQSVLSWDELCHMPEQGASYRGEQQAFLRSKSHELRTSKEYQDLVQQALKDVESLPESDFTRRHLELTQEKVEKLKCLPKELVEELSIAESNGVQSWEKARHENDYNLFSGAFKGLIELQRKKVDLLGNGYDHPYDVFLDEYEPGVTVEYLDQLFSVLATEIKGILANVRSDFTKQRLLDSSEFTLDKQESLGQILAASLGMEKKRTLLSTSSHPFSTTLGPGDFRITTRYQLESPVPSFLAVAHEVGHSLYEQGLPKQAFHLLSGQACSYGVHESQSLFWEKRVACHQSFCHLWFETFLKLFPNSFEKKNPDDLYFLLNQVVPGLNRVDSDEISYCLHIMIRYEIEKKLITGQLKVEELPEAWAEYYQKYLGVSPSNHKEGCLQDIHWATGTFGYFPSYALGHLISAQFCHQMEKDLEPFSTLLKSESFAPVKGWLNDHVYKQAALYKPLELVKVVSHESLDASYFTNYLKEKFCKNS